MTTLIQRPLRGSRISSFYPVKTLPTLASLDSAFQLQEYISLLIRLDVHDVDSIVAVPGKAGSKELSEEEAKTEDKDGDKERKSEVVVDQACWIYEQLRYGLHCLMSLRYSKSMQSTGTRFDPPSDNDAAARMYAFDVS